MKYTFSDDRSTSFLCLSCFNTVKLDFHVEISGDTADAVVPKLIRPDHNYHDVMCGRCGDRMVGIDEDLLPYISWLNQHGYTTQFCCSGHIVHECIPANIVGPHYFKDYDFKRFPAHLTDEADPVVRLRDVKGGPQSINYLDPPNLIFAPDMDERKFDMLWDVISSMYNPDADRFKIYSDFTPMCTFINQETGGIYNAPFDPELKESAYRILLSIADDYRCAADPTLGCSEALLCENQFARTLGSFRGLLENLVTRLKTKDALMEFKATDKEDDE